MGSKMTNEQLVGLKNRVLSELVMCRATSERKTIGMGELFQRVFGEEWSHRINDTRKLRRIITALRNEGVPIASKAAKSGGGYYLPEGSEFVDFCGRYKKRAIKVLAMVSKFEKRTLPELLGQLVISAGAQQEADNGEKTAK